MLKLFKRKKEEPKERNFIFKIFDKDKKPVKVSLKERFKLLKKVHKLINREDYEDFVFLEVDGNTYQCVEINGKFVCVEIDEKKLAEKLFKVRDIIKEKNPKMYYKLKPFFDELEKAKNN